jgi:hypothetical protein
MRAGSEQQVRGRDDVERANTRRGLPLTRTWCFEWTVVRGCPEEGKITIIGAGSEVVSCASGCLRRPFPPPLASTHPPCPLRRASRPLPSPPLPKRPLPKRPLPKRPLPSRLLRIPLATPL